MGLLDNTHGGNILNVQKKHKKKLIDFSANINPIGLPLNVKKALAKNIGSIVHYPGDGRELKAKIAQHWKIKEENILLGNGSVELIYLLMNALRPKKTTICIPAFSEYERAAKSVNSKIQFFKLRESNGFKIEPGIAPQCDACFIGNPNNPTGNLLIDKKKLLKRIPANLFVIDEAFMDFLQDQKDISLIGEAVKSKKICVLRTFTKYYAIPGLRLGYLIAHQQVVKKLSRFQPPWSVNALAQVAAERLLADSGFKDKTDHVIEKERKLLFEGLSRIDGLKCYPSEANFLLIKIKNLRFRSSNILQEELVKRGILIRDCSNFRGLGRNFIRVAVRNRTENEKLIREIKKSCNR